MQEARPKPEAGCRTGPIAHGVANRLQCRLVGLVHRDVTEHGEVVARLDTIDVRLQVGGERRAARCSFERRGVALVRK